MKEYIEKLTMRECCIDEDGQTDEPIIKKLNEVIDFINSVDVASIRNGRWIEHQHFHHDHYIDSTYECSKCNVEEPWTSDYCPNCGCKMNLEEV